jgi:lysophosphatidylcholine acyltransferase/lyso-PAF acetyltransferase
VIPFQKDIEYDYTEYLGPDYKTETRSDRVSTIVSNHASWTDIIILIAGKYSPSFAAKKELRTTPIIGLLTSALQSIFINRGASEEERVQIIKQICHR